MNTPIKNCLSCILAALVLSLTDASQQTRKMEKALPESAGLARLWNECSDFLHLNQLSRAQRDWLKSSPLWTGQEEPEGDGWDGGDAALAGTEEPTAPEVTTPTEEPITPEVASTDDLTIPEVTTPTEEPTIPEVTTPTEEPTTPEVATTEEPATPDVATTEEPTTPEVATTEEPATPEVASTEEPATPEVASTEEPTSPEVTTPTEEPATPEVATTEEPATPEVATTEEQKEDVIDENAPLPNVKCKVMLAGDSLMQSLGPTFYKEWKNHPGLQFILTARHSTGLTQPEYYNWPEHMDELLKKYRPDVVIVLMGGNDALPIPRPKRLEIDFASDLWKSTYKSRVKDLHDVAVRNKCDMIWMGLPIFGGKMTNKLGLVRDMQEEGCKECGVTFINNLRTLADSNGQFQAYGPGVNGKNVRLRRKDQIHMTKEGDELLVRNAKKTFELWLRRYAKAHPERCMGEEEAKNHQNPKIQAPSI